MEEWLETYRGYDEAELDAEIAWLKKQVRNPFSSQTEGGRAVARSTSEFRDRLAAATRVRNENSGVDNGDRTMVADFSQVRP